MFNMARRRYIQILLVMILLLTVNIFVQTQDVSPTDIPAQEIIATETPTATIIPAVPTETPTLTIIPTHTATIQPTATDIPTEIVNEATIETLPEVTADVSIDQVDISPIEEITIDLPTSEVILSPTPMNIVIIPDEPALSLLVRESFNNGDLSAWTFTPAWSLVANESGQALQVVHSNDALILQKGSFQNIAIQASFLLQAGEAQLSIQKSEVGDYTAALDASGLLTLYRNGLELQSSLALLDPDTSWHRLRLSSIDGIVRVAVDANQVIAWQDDAPLPAGTVGLSANFDLDEELKPENSLLVDDFLLWIPATEMDFYPSPTPASQAIEVIVAPTETIVEVLANPSTTVIDDPDDSQLSSLVIKDVSPVAPPNQEIIALAVEPPNNNFASATTISSLPFIASGDTTAATTQASETLPSCGIHMSNTIWYKFIPANSADYLLSSGGSDFDTILAIYTGSAVDALTQVACNDDANNSTFSSQFSLQLNSGTTYYIQLGGYNGRYGNFAFSLQQIGITIPKNAPAPISPFDKSYTNQDSNPLPDLSWTAVNDAHHYEIQIDADKKFSSPDQVASDIMGLSYSVLDLPDSAGTTYYWHVRALNINNQAGAWSKARRFTVDTTAPLAPVLKSPKNGAISSKTQEKFTWKGSKDSKIYLVDIDNNSNFASPVYVNSLASKQFVPPVSLPQDNYFWRVQGQDVAGNVSDESDESDVWSFTINILTSPKDESTIFTKGSTAKVSLKWAKVKGASNYLLYLYDNLTCSSLLSGYPLDMGTSTSRTEYLGSGQYCWKVQAVGVDAGIPPVFKTFIVSPPALSAPILLSPPNNSTSNDKTPTLDWDTVTDADKYTLEWSTDSRFRSNVESMQLTDPTSQFTLPTLPGAPGTRYYWRVNAVSDLGVIGKSSKAFNFRINILTDPKDGATIFTKGSATSSNVTMKWASVNDATSYMLYLYNDATCTSLLAGYPMDMGTNTSKTESLDHAQYCWKVQAVGVDAGIPDVFSTFIVSPPALNPPVLISPANNSSTDDKTPTLDWDAVTNADSYLLQWSTNSGFKSNVESMLVNDPTSQFTLPTLPDTGGTRYYWRVSSINEFGAQGKSSKTFNFILDTTAFNAPILKSPSDGAVTSNAKQALVWQAIKGAKSYWVDLDNNSDFSSPLYLDSLASKQFIPSDSLAQGSYFWRVQVEDVAGNVSAESDEWSFTVNILTTPKDGTSIFTKGSTTSNVTLKWAKVNGASSYLLYLYDNLGCSSLLSGYPLDMGTGLSKGETLDQGQYCWKVRAVGVDAGIPPVFNTFIVSPPALQAPRLVSPFNKSTSNDTTPTLDWDAVTNADKYLIEWSTDSRFRSNVNSAMVDAPTSQLTLPTLPDTGGTGYYWRVGTINDLGAVGSMSKPFNFVLDTIAPDAPKLSSPADESVTTKNPPTFTWSKVKGAVSYEIALDTVDPPLVIDALTSNKYIAPSPLLLKTYYWRVRSIDKAGNVSDWSNAGDSREVKVNSVNLAPPVLNRHASGNPYPMDLPPTLCWSPISWAEGYELQVDNNSNFNSPIYSNNSIASNEQCLTLPALSDGTWYWRVRATRTSGGTTWSPRGTFTVES